MQALILAGGKGARLQPYTNVLPKPLMPLGEHPILDIILRQLKLAGATDVILAVGYLGHLLQAFFGDGDKYGLKITYSIEDAPLGTAGPIGLVLDRLDDDFLVMNGDLLTTLNYRHFFDFHMKMNAAATIGIYSREVKIDFGVIQSDENGFLVDYIEKPAYQFDVSMGINGLKLKEIRSYIHPGEHLDLPDLMLRLHRDDRPVLCYREPCEWLDIGRVDDYQKAIDVFQTRSKDFLDVDTL
jgi:NDP-sugar pyrophosphorylase family protein